MVLPKTWLFAAACAASVASAPLANAATAADKAAAEALFDEGLRLMKAGSFAEACPKLESSEQIDPAVGTLLYLAECYEKVGRTASAWATFREAASLAQNSGQIERAKKAQDRAARLEPDLAYVTIEVSSDARQIPGLSLRRGPTPVALQLSGVATPVDPGELVIEASAPGRATFSTKVSVAPRGRLQVSIPPLAELPASGQPAAPAAVSAAPTTLNAPPPVASTAPPASPDAAHKKPFPVVPVVLGGVGIVGIGVGSFFGLRAISKASDARGICPGGHCTAARGETLMNDARDAAKVSNLSFGIGAGLLAAGVLMYVLTPSTDTSVGVIPVVSPSSAGLVWSARL